MRTTIILAGIAALAAAQTSVASTGASLSITSSIPLGPGPAATTSTAPYPITDGTTPGGIAGTGGVAGPTGGVAGGTGGVAGGTGGVGGVGGGMGGMSTVGGGATATSGGNAAASSAMSAGGAAGTTAGAGGSSDATSAKVQVGAGILAGVGAIAAAML